MPFAIGVPGSPRVLRGSVLFASGPGFWVTRPGFWLLVALALFGLVFVSRPIGWAALTALLLASRASKARWRMRELQRMQPLPADA